MLIGTMFALLTRKNVSMTFFMNDICGADVYFSSYSFFTSNFDNLVFMFLSIIVVKNIFFWFFFEQFFWSQKMRNTLKCIKK